MSNQNDTPDYGAIRVVTLDMEAFDKAMADNPDLLKEFSKSGTLRPGEPSPFTGSLAEMIRLLPVGKSCAKVEPIDLDNMPAKGDTSSMLAMRQQLRNSLASTIERARQNNGGTYKVEVSEMSMPSGSLYVAAVVTRTA